MDLYQKINKITIKLFDNYVSLVQRAFNGDKKVIFGTMLFASPISFVSTIIELSNQGEITRRIELVLIAEFALWLGLLFSWLIKYTKFRF
jgi:hypothetical protein